MRVRLHVFLCSLALIMGSASSALAQTGEASDVVPDQAVPDLSVYPLSVALRPETLPERMLRIDGTARLTRNQPRTLEDSLELAIRYGVLDQLEVGATLLPIALGLLDTEFEYQDPSLYVRYQWLEDDLRLGFQVAGTIPIGDESDATVHAGVLLTWVQDRMKLDFALTTHLLLADEMVIGLNAPLGVRYSVTERVFFGIHTGFSAADTSDIGETWSLPLTTMGGLAFGDDTPSADITVSLRFPRFVHGDGTDTDLWEMTAQTLFYLGL